MISRRILYIRLVCNESFRLFLPLEIRDKSKYKIFDNFSNIVTVRVLRHAVVKQRIRSKQREVGIPDRGDSACGSVEEKIRRVQGSINKL